MPITCLADSEQRACNIQNNVFKGPRSLHDYYDPDLCPPLPLVELPEQLNPYGQHGVRIYAKMMTVLPATNVKSLPALNMLLEAGLDQERLPHAYSGLSTPPLDAEDSPRKKEMPHTVVEYSSGSTAISLGILSRIMGIPCAQTFISNKTSAVKLELLRFFGLELTLFGGPSQPEPDDERGGIRAANVLGQKDGFFNPDQYSNRANYGAHQRWTGPQILRQLPELSLVAAGMGTAGTMTGIGLSVKAGKPSVYRLGVCTKAGDRVPGPRSEPLLAPVTFPWREALDELENVGSVDAYRLSLALSRAGLLAGPSSGLTLQGLYNHLEKRLRNGTLDDIRDPQTGIVSCVFVCCDLPYQYVGEYESKLGSDYFPPIHNELLINSDKYRYDEAWEISQAEAEEACYEHDSVAVLDLRAEEHACTTLGGLDVQALSLSCLAAGPDEDGKWPCPFSHAEVLHEQWSAIETLLVRWQAPDKKMVIVLCGNGNTARVATSAMRHRGVKAFSVRGGVQ